ncbi:hypothetical protein SAMD00019534_068240 [Acytostelium subglobosum LB1]|uniref:hypothetical protein n=1 Tax=Acytostelium subglobosum LB1 TaxID=1410327 RepID=UPI000644C1CD|nr:hypothetical protein SAMD00019534_068240 [Acytostelium subglobosum LB1]GAM23649.1 hypothetical protein SAMD00019534_068240 [Acytostelium subglobosum LB1]|eukprot:XP_012753390.1 hypothetical protein SAMD00019534_068240 [Acytostelium subglobosum LB1]
MAVEITDDSLRLMQEWADKNNELLSAEINTKLQIQVILGLTVVLVTLLAMTCLVWFLNKKTISEYYRTKQQSTLSLFATEINQVDTPFTPITKEIEQKIRK